MVGMVDIRADYLLSRYFGTCLPALARPSNMGNQLDILLERRSRPTGDPESAIPEHAVMAVSELRPIEKRLARLSRRHVDVLRATYGEPLDVRWMDEWTWLVRACGHPLPLLSMAAQTAGITLSQLLRWKQASAPAEKRERAEGLLRLERTASRLKKEAVSAWIETRPGGVDQSPRVLRLDALDAYLSEMPT